MTLRRFLRGRNFDVDKAGAMFLKYIKWRRSFVPNGFISESEIKNEIAQNKIFAGGNDKKGRPILVLSARRHFQNTTPGGYHEFKRMFSLTLYIVLLNLFITEFLILRVFYL